jgi:hypothetical protein
MFVLPRAYETFVDLGHPVWALLFSCFQNDLAPKYVSAPDKGCSRSYIYIFILLWNMWAHLIKVVQEAISTFLFCFEICERTWSRLFKKLYLHFYFALKFVSAPDQGCSRSYIYIFIWLWNMWAHLIKVVQGCSRNALCALSLVSTFSLLFQMFGSMTGPWCHRHGHACLF